MVGDLRLQHSDVVKSTVHPLRGKAAQGLSEARGGDAVDLAACGSEASALCAVFLAEGTFSDNQTTRRPRTLPQGQESGRVLAELSS